MLLLLLALVALVVSESGRWPRSMRTLSVDVTNLSAADAQLMVFKKSLEETHEAVTAFYENVIKSHEYVVPVLDKIITKCEASKYTDVYAVAFSQVTGLDNCSYLIYRTFLEFSVDPIASIVNAKAEVFISYSEAVRQSISKNGHDIYSFIQSALYTLEIFENNKKLYTTSYIAGTNCIPFAMNYHTKTGIARVHDNLTTREQVMTFNTHHGVLDNPEKFAIVLEEAISNFLDDKEMAIASSKIANFVFLRNTQDPIEYFVKGGNAKYATPTIFLFSKDINGTRTGEIYGFSTGNLPVYTRTLNDDWKLVQSSDRRYVVEYGNDSRIISVERKLEETSDNRTLENLYNTLRTYPARTNITSYIIAVSLTDLYAFMQKCSNIKDSAGVAACMDPAVPFADLWYIFFISLILAGVVIAFWVLGAKYNKIYNRQRQSIIDADSVDDAAELVIDETESDEKSNELELHD